ncbi:TPA: hypothetical protein DDW35_00480 [Candidatus Sumerlaeota bacterium]|jgi:hypothetical protein|nr:hypothetical protein [Candidatus Sumerlaeota bacterium]
MKTSTKNKPHKEISEILKVQHDTGIQQKVLAATAGMAPEQISRLSVGGRKNPRIDTITRLWEALGRLIPVERLPEFPKAFATESAQKRLGLKKVKRSNGGGKHAPR